MHYFNFINNLLTYGNVENLSTSTIDLADATQKRDVNKLEWKDLR